MKRNILFLYACLCFVCAFAGDRIMANAEFSYNGNIFCQSLGINLVPQHLNGGTDGTYTATVLLGNGNIVIDANTGIIDLAASAVGTYIVTNTIAPSINDPLGDIFQQTIIIVATPDATFSYDATAYCKGENNPIITISQVGGTFDYTSFTGGILDLDTLTGFVNLATSTAGTFVVGYSMQPVGGCNGSIVTQVLTIDEQADPEFYYDANAYCKTGTNPILLHNTGTNGTYSFSVVSGGPALNLAPNTGAINLAASDFGTYIITNNHPANGACPASTHSQTLVVENAPDAEFHYDKNTYCGLYSIPLILHISGVNGTYSYQVLTGGPNLALNPQTGSIDLLFTNNGSYQVTNIVESQGVCKADTHTVQVTYANNPQATIFPTGNFDLCNLDTLLMTSGGGDSYIWLKNSLSVGVANDTFVVNSPGAYSVIAYNEYNCSDTSEIVSIYENAQPNADILTGPVLICSGQVTTIVGEGTGIYFQWLQNGDSIMGATGESLTVTDGGFYTFIAQNACGFDSSSVFITKSDGLIGDFFIENENNYVGIPALFRDQSVNAYQWFWDYGNGETATIQNPNYAYTEIGTYLVTMIVTDRFGCKDTSVETVNVKPFYEDDVFIPNIFSPNADGFYDALQVQAAGMATFEMQIFDRWGKKVFMANSPDKSWEGTNLEGIKCNAGVYYFVIKGTDGVGNIIQRKGSIVLAK